MLLSNVHVIKSLFLDNIIQKKTRGRQMITVLMTVIFGMICNMEMYVFENSMDS